MTVLSKSRVRQQYGSAAVENSDSSISHVYGSSSTGLAYDGTCCAIRYTLIHIANVIAAARSSDEQITENVGE